jgi:hypothetical protein
MRRRLAATAEELTARTAVVSEERDVGDRTRASLHLLQQRYDELHQKFHAVTLETEVERQAREAAVEAAEAARLEAAAAAEAARAEAAAAKRATAAAEAGAAPEKLRLQEQLESVGLRLLKAEREREEAVRGFEAAEGRRRAAEEAAEAAVEAAQAAATSAEARAEAAGAALQEERRRYAEEHAADRRKKHGRLSALFLHDDDDVGALEQRARSQLVAAAALEEALRGQLRDSQMECESLQRRLSHQMTVMSEQPACDAHTHDRDDNYWRHHEASWDVPTTVSVDASTAAPSQAAVGVAAARLGQLHAAAAARLGLWEQQRQAAAATEVGGGSDEMMDERVPPRSRAVRELASTLHSLGASLLQQVRVAHQRQLFGLV